MKRLMIEQVENGYVVTDKLNVNDHSPYETKESGIYVFETFASMSDWLRGHFEPIHATSSAPLPLGNNDDF